MALRRDASTLAAAFVSTFSNHWRGQTRAPSLRHEKPMHADNAALAAEYQQYLGEAEKWFRHAKEVTHAGVDTKSARGVATGYTGEPYGPLAVFNEWADRQFAKQLAPGYFDAANLSDRAAFDVWQAEMVRDIRAHWSKKRVFGTRGKTHQIEFPPLPFLQASRLANSFIKALRVKCNKRPHVLEAISCQRTRGAERADVGRAPRPAHDTFRVQPAAKRGRSPAKLSLDSTARARLLCGIWRLSTTARCLRS